MSLIILPASVATPAERLRRPALGQAPPPSRHGGTRRPCRRPSRQRAPMTLSAPPPRRPARSARPGWRTWRSRTLPGIGNEMRVMISPSCSAVVNRPLKKSSALISRLLVPMRGAERQQGRGIVGCGIVVGDRAADGAAVAHVRVADDAGHLGQARQWPSAPRTNSPPPHAWSWRR